VIFETLEGVKGDTELMELLEICEHLTEEGPRNQRNASRIRFKLLRYRERLLLRTSTNLIPDLKSMELHEKAAFKYNSPKSRLSKIDLPINGYFQNWKYVDEVWETMKVEFATILMRHLRKLQNDNKLTKPSIVLHIRGGDFLTLDNHLGLLPPQYYKKALLEIQKLSLNFNNFVIATNDLSYATCVLSSIGINNYQILDPREYSEWDTLAIMSKAEVVVVSNSTFSWWGGYLCLKNGGVCISPDSWYRFNPRDSGSGLNHPEFKVIENAFDLVI
jgi:hypothetical protein